MPKRPHLLLLTALLAYEKQHEFDKMLLAASQEFEVHQLLLASLKEFNNREIASMPVAETIRTYSFLEVCQLQY